MEIIGSLINITPVISSILYGGFFNFVWDVHANPEYSRNNYSANSGNYFQIRDCCLKVTWLREIFRSPQICLNVNNPSSADKMPSILHELSVPFKKATFGMGCFWACDALFGAQQGVLRTRVGYSGGATMDPQYRKLGDHTEVIEIDYDPKIVGYEDLLQLFWNNHEFGLTTIIKRQYMSLILYHDDDQKRIAEISLKKEAHKHNDKLVTEIASAGAFYPAENYHQKYRLQEHSWLCEELGLTPELLQTSHVAARLNGYLVGVGKIENFEKDVIKLGLSDKIAKYVRTHLQQNEGGNLYC